MENYNIKYGKNLINGGSYNDITKRALSNTQNSINKHQYEMVSSSIVCASDVTAYISVPILNKTDSPIILANLHTISTSSYSDSFEVRELGSRYSSGMTRGPRTVGGTLVFATINQWQFSEVANQINKNCFDNFTENSSLNNAYPSILYADELPPFNMYIFMANEYGKIGYRKIEGVNILGDSDVISVWNIKVDTTYLFKAIHITPWQSGNPFNSTSTNTFNTNNSSYQA